MAVCCAEARKADAELQAECDRLVTEPCDVFREHVEAEPDGFVSISYTPPAHLAPRIYEIVATQRTISDGWCPVHTWVH